MILWTSAYRVCGSCKGFTLPSSMDIVYYSGIKVPLKVWCCCLGFLTNGVGVWKILTIYLIAIINPIEGIRISVALNMHMKSKYVVIFFYNISRSIVAHFDENEDYYPPQAALIIHVYFLGDVFLDVIDPYWNNFIFSSLSNVDSIQSTLHNCSPSTWRWILKRLLVYSVGLQQN